MGTSDLDSLIMSPPDFSGIDRRKIANIQDHHRYDLSPPTPENIAHPQTKDQDQDQKTNQEDANSGGLKVVVTSFSDDDHPKTPTSREHRIPAMSACPPAPRKVSRSGKRKAPFLAAAAGDRCSAADFRVYVDAMLALNEVVYVPDIVVGDLGAGDSAKRLKTSSLADQP